MTATRGVPEDKPILTLLTDRLVTEFRAWDTEVTDEDVRIWVSCLEGDDLLTQSIRRMFAGNKGWGKLVASRVNRKLR